MKIITRQHLANTAAKRWNDQYSGSYHAPDKYQKGLALNALVDPTPEKVEEIIGNRSWTRLKCSLMY